MQTEVWRISRFWKYPVDSSLAQRLSKMFSEVDIKFCEVFKKQSWQKLREADLSSINL